jgi:hypothetical protein
MTGWARLGYANHQTPGCGCTYIVPLGAWYD